MISPNEVFGDIMVLASPPPPPPVDPDDVNTLTRRISLKLYLRVDTPLRYVAIEIVSPKFSKCNISISNGPIDLIQR